jgi:hypothetical protein
MIWLTYHCKHQVVWTPYTLNQEHWIDPAHCFLEGTRKTQRLAYWICDIPTLIYYDLVNHSQLLYSVVHEGTVEVTSRKWKTEVVSWLTTSLHVSSTILPRSTLSVLWSPYGSNCIEGFSSKLCSVSISKLWIAPIHFAENNWRNTSFLNLVVEYLVD